jgi:predicted O-methyltransferase YrrM
MRPAGLVTVCNDVVLNGRSRIVELGSGISTVLLSRLLRQQSSEHDVRLVAVEHDERWAQWVSDQLDRERIRSGVDVVHCPLAPHPAALDGLEWYDQEVVLDALDTNLSDDPIDLLLVDGPPAYLAGFGRARYPALPVLGHRLGPGATVVLDDVERPGEQEILNRWERETDLRFDRQAGRAGIAIAWVGGDGAPGGPPHG